MVCLDTNVVIEYFDGNDRVIRAVDRLITGGDVSITVMNAYELYKHFYRDVGLEEFLVGVNIHDLTEDSARISGELYKRFREEGEMINELDILIAGIVMDRGETLLTLDKDFKRIRNLKTVML